MGARARHGRWGATRASRPRRLALAVAALLGASAIAVAGAVPAVAADPVLAISTQPSTTTVQSGGQLDFIVQYSCSSLVGSCDGVELRMPTPTGVSPSGPAPAPALAFATLIGNADVASSAGDASGATVTLASLPGGAVGQLTVVWNIPPLVVLPGTTYTQTVSASGSGIPAFESVSAPATVDAESDLQVALALVSPSTATAVAQDMDVVYRVYDCNPGAASLGALAYGGVGLTLVFPAGTQFVDAGGGIVSASTISWTDAEVTTNDCTAPTRSKTVTVRYPTAAFVPPAANPVLLNTFDVTASGSATSLDGTALTAVPSSIEHTIRGPAGLLPVGSSWLNWKKWFIGPSAEAQGITDVDTTTPYTWSITSEWHTDQIGLQPVNPGIYETQALRDRLPCVTASGATSPATTNRDPIVNTVPPAWSAPTDLCLTPAFKTDSITFGDVSAPSIESIEVYTTDGTGLGGHYQWTRQQAFGSAIRAKIFDVYGVTGAPPVLGAPTDPDDAIGAIEGGDDVGSGLGADPAWDETVTDPEHIALGVPADEIVTDLRIVWTYMPYYTWVWASLKGTSTPAFAQSGFLQMTNSLLATGSAFRFYTIDQPPTYGGQVLESPGRIRTQVFAQARPDPAATLTPSVDVTSLAPGREVPWSATITNGTGGTPLNPKVVVVLPPGLEVVPGSDVWSNLDALDGVQPTRTEVVQTGYADGIPRQSLVYEWPAANVLDNPENPASPDHPLYLSGALPKLDLVTRVTLAAQEGSHTGDQAMSVTVFHDSTDLAPKGSDVPLDTHDLDQDGVTAEQVGFASVGWTTTATSGARIEQHVRGDLDADWGTSGSSSGAWPDGGTAEYRLTVHNDNLVPIGDLVIYDVLPRPGDTAIGEALAGEARGSAFPVLFDGVTEPGGTTVAYSTSSNPCRPELFPAGQVACDDDWSASPPATAADVTALRFSYAGPYASTDAANPPLEIRFAVVTPGVEPTVESLAPAAVNAALAASIPGTANNNVAWRATRLDPDLPPRVFEPAEAPVTLLAVASGTLGASAFCDADDDAVHDDGEPAAPTVNVALLDADGEPIESTAGPVETTTTGEVEAGFAVPFGAYRVSFSGYPDGLALVDPNVGGDDARDSDADPATGVTDVIDVTPATPDVRTIEAGFRSAQLALSAEVDTSRATQGARVGYTFTVENVSPDLAASGVVVIVALPAGLDFASSDRPATARGDSVGLEIGDLEPGAAATATLQASIGADGADVLTVDVSATDAGPCSDTASVALSTSVDRPLPATGVAGERWLTLALAALLAGAVLVAGPTMRRRRRARA